MCDLIQVPLFYYICSVIIHLASIQTTMQQNLANISDCNVLHSGKSEEIRNLELKLHKATSVLAAHQIALWEYDIKTKECTFNEKYFHILGLDKVGIHYDNLEEFCECVHPDDRHLVSLDTFYEKVSNQEKSMLRIRCVGSKGEIVWLEDHFLDIQRGNDGQPEKLYCYAVNVTEQCEREEKIRQLEEKNWKIIEALPEFIFIFDDNFFFKDVLMSSNTVLLHNAEELIGTDGRLVYSPEVSDLFVRNIRQCLKDGQLKEIEYPLDVPGHERRYFQARIAPFENNTALALIHDIGDRVQRSNELIEAKQRAEEADRMKSVFLANMSHEIRTPLNAIVGFSEIIALTESEEEKSEYLGIIQKNSNLLLQLINDILDLSRIESGKSEMNIQLTEMRALIVEMEKIHRLKMKTNVRLHVEGLKEELWILTDRNRLTQVLFNFLSNAIKNTEEGTITLGAVLEEEYLKIYVSDTGCGIPKEKLPLIFNRFEKLNDFVQGTGLGLSICQSIVERLGGKIDVESELGVGSTFMLYLPYQQVTQRGHGELIESLDEKGKTSSKRKKILIVEDTESNYLQINILLKKDYTISWAVNGEEAINSFLRERPDLILMDIRMPVMNGVQATEKIRAIAPNLPIIAVTANAFLIEQQQALAAGCNDIISKPYTFEKLSETISRYI